MCVQSAMKMFLVFAVSATPAFAAAAEEKPDAAPPKPKVEVSSWAKVSPRQKAAAKKLGVPVGFENSVGMRFVLIPAGKFMMGSRDSAAEVARKCNMPNALAGWFCQEHPRHEVVITKPFYMAIHEVTNGAYEQTVDTKPKTKGKKKKAGDSPPPKPKDPKLPWCGISCKQAEEFCNALGRRDKRKYSVPTEAQWEYACRAGTTTPFCFGETISTDQANYNGNYTYDKGRKGKNRQKPVHVGTFPPNAWGLYDMHGNVGEWCGTPYEEYGKVADPKKPARDRNSRVLRGSAWRSYPGACRSAFRLESHQNTRAGHIGFRPVCALPEKQENKEKKKK